MTARRPPKRPIPTKTYLRPEIREGLEALVERRRKRGVVITLSEYLAEFCERHVVEQRAMEISEQMIGGRVGNQ